MRKRFKQFRLIFILGAFFFLMPFITHAESHSVEEALESSNQIENITDAEQMRQSEEISVNELIEEMNANSHDNQTNKKAENDGEVETEEKNNKKIERDDIYSNGEEQLIPSAEESIENQRRNDMIQPQNILDTRILSNTSLDAEYSRQDNKHYINLIFSGRSLIELGVGNTTYVRFVLSSEIGSLITNENKSEILEATYSVPSILVGTRTGKIDLDDINIEGNSVTIGFFNFIQVSVARNSTFTLTLKLDDLPISNNHTYDFLSVGYTDNLIDLSILENNYDVTTLPTPPEAPVINEPIYNNHTIVEGTGLPGINVELTIGEQSINGVVDENGRFQIAIEEQIPRTVISAVLINELGMRSPPDTVIVQEATISFYHVPEYILFEPTELKPGFQQIPIEFSDGVLSVVDTRGRGSPINILAQAEPLFNRKYNHTLSNVIKYRDERGVIHDLSETQEIYSGTTGEDQITEIRWDENQGPFIEVDPSNAYEGTYNSTITWTLVDGP